MPRQRAPLDPGAGDAILVPGQGSQHEGMRRLVERAAPGLIEAAADLTGADPFARVTGCTRLTQPAIYCASVASWRLIADRVRPTAFAGHSFGEFAALVAADALDMYDGLALVTLRGRLTEEVAAQAGGGMVAVLGLDAETARSIADGAGAVLANDNCPGQAVLSGTEPALAEVEREVAARGAQTRRLAVNGPFHSPLMAAAVGPLEQALVRVRFGEPSVPVYSGVTAAPFTDTRRQLAQSLVSPVRWRETVQQLGATVRRFVELAPGEVLSKMARRTVHGVPRMTAEKELQERDNP